MSVTYFDGVETFYKFDSEEDAKANAPDGTFPFVPNEHGECGDCEKKKASTKARTVNGATAKADKEQ